MRLAAKLVGSVVLVIAALLAIDGALAIATETERLEIDMQRDARLLGGPVADLAGEVWARVGEARARALIVAADLASDEIALQLVVPDRAEDARDELAWADWVAELSAATQRDERVVTVLPVHSGDQRVGALVLSEPRAQLDRSVRAAATRTLVLVATTGVMGGLLVLWLGVAMIGRPVARLADKVRRIGSGDLDGPLALRGGDELSELAGGLNKMCDRLAEAQEHTRSAQAARLAALDQLRQADRLRTVGRLASEIAHELGTPLHVVAGRADVIASGDVSGDTVAESARIIKRQSQRMTATIRRLLDFSRLEKLERERLDVNDLAHEAFELLQPLAKSHGVVMACPDRGRPIWVEVTAASIQQVLANLVVNALQATGQAGVVTIEAGWQRRRRPAEVLGEESDWAYLRVCDDGAGIPEIDLAHLFEPFYTTKDRGAGTGLGLSIAAGIVTEHGGFIDVQSTPGEGSGFTVFLPRVAS